MIRSPQSQRQEEEIAQHHLLPELSPFQNGRRHRQAHVTPTAALPGIGYVVSVSEERDSEGNPVRCDVHLVGIECRHWAPSARETGDCRFGCLKDAA
jgi:hypothetical protein